MRYLYEIKNSLYRLLPALMVKFCLDIVALGFIGSVLLDYDGRLLQYATIGKYLLSWVLFVLLYGRFRKLYGGKSWQELRFSDYLLVFLGMFSVVPAGSLYGRGAFSNQYFWYFCYFWLTLLLGMFYLRRAAYGKFLGNYCRVLKVKYGLWLYYFIALVSFGLVVCVMYVYGVSPVFFKTMSLTSPAIYEQRAYFASIVKPVWLKYALANLPMINLWCIACFLNKKKYIWLFLSVLGQFLLFSLDGSKIVLLGLIAFVCAYVIWPYLTWKRLTMAWCGVSAFLFVFTKFNTYILQIVDIIYRRHMFLPAMLGSCYFDFFLHNAPMYFDRDMYPDLPYRIGELYLNAPVASANNGLTAEAVAVWGLWGCIIHPLCLAVFFTMLDFASCRVKSRVLFGMSIFFGTVLINSFLRTSLLSHGFLVSLLMMFCWPEENIKDEGRESADVAIG